MALIRDAAAPNKIVGAWRRMFGGVQSPAETAKKIQRLGMTPIQRELNWLLAWYSGCQYEALQHEWDGSAVLSPFDLEAMGTRKGTPPNFVGGEEQSKVPRAMRKPKAPYQLARAVIDRFTSFLFSEEVHPRLEVLGDQKTEDYLTGLCEASAFWPTWELARGHGGAMGTTCVGFKFVRGRLRLEVHDVRWITPEFLDRETHELASIDIRYQRETQVEKPGKPGEFETKYYWIRRFIDAQVYVDYEPVWVTDEEPDWEQHIQERIEHNFGFCPAVWVLNLPQPDDDFYGACDIHALHPMIREIDELQSAASHDTLANCESTLSISAPNCKIPTHVTKGVGKTLIFEGPDGGQANYVESTGVGAKNAQERADKCREQFLECAQCVLDQQQSQGPAKTATETELLQGPMKQKVWRLRGRYGEAGVKPLVEKLLQAVRALQTRGVPVYVPPRVDTLDDGTQKVTPRVLGPGGYLQCTWHTTSKPTAEDLAQGTTAVVPLQQGGIINKRIARKYILPLLGEEDVPQALRDLEAEDKKAEAEEAKQLEMQRQAQMGYGAPQEE